MIPRGKTISAGLQLLNTADPEFEEIQKSIPNVAASLYVLPMTQGLYPLSEVSQAVVTWDVLQMPAAATFIKLTPVAFHGIWNDKAAALYRPGLLVAGLGVAAFYRYQWNEFQIGPPAQVVPHPLTWIKTVADGTTTVNGVACRDGTHHLHPVYDPYVGWLIEHNGGLLGNQTLHVDLVYG